MPATNFVEIDETADQAAVREAKEETGLDIAVIGVFRALSDTSSKVKDQIVVYYFAQKVGGRLQPGDDAKDARFFASASLPKNITFRAHKRLIEVYFKEAAPSSKLFFRTNKRAAIRELLLLFILCETPYVNN